MGDRFTLLSEADYDDYRASLDWYEYPEHDFELIEIPESPKPAHRKFPKGFVEIRRKSTGVARRYQVGVGSRWTSGFDRDLRKGVFGRPRP